MIDTVIFDLGNVLVDFHPDKAMRGLGFPEETVQHFMERVFSGFWESCDKYPYTDEEIRTLFKRVVPGYEKEVDLLWDNIPDITGARPFADEWLKSLKDQGLRVLVLSNYGKQSFTRNSHLYTFMKHFDGGIISYKVIMLKPEPQIYQELINRYNIVPENAVFLDDREDNIAAAEAFGIHGIVFKDYESAKAKLDELIKNS